MNQAPMQEGRNTTKYSLEKEKDVMNKNKSLK